MKHKINDLFMILICIYANVCAAFFYHQYTTIQRVNSSKYSDFEYFIRDNVVVLLLFVAISLTIYLNLFHSIEYWVFQTKKDVKTQVILGYRHTEILRSYYGSFIKGTGLAFLISMIPSYFLLTWFKLPIFIPFLLSFGVTVLTISGFVFGMLYTLLKKYAKGRHFDFRFGKVVTIVLQLSISTVLMSLALVIINDSYGDVSPYRYYASMDRGWMLQGETLSDEKRIQYERNPEHYLQGLDRKILDIYEEYKASLIVNFTSSFEDRELGSVLFLNLKSLAINNVDSALFDAYRNANQQPILLNNSFQGKYKAGDIIKHQPIDYVVVGVLSKDARIRTVAPNDFGDLESTQKNIALFDTRYLDNSLNLQNFNFLNTIFFENVSLDVVEGIKARLDLPDFHFDIYAISALQSEFNSQKMITIGSYLLIGATTLLFSVLGLIAIIHMDVKARANDFSVYKVVGYQDSYLCWKYAMMTGSLFVSACGISQLFAIKTGSLRIWVSLLVGGLLVGIYGFIVSVSNRSIKRIEPLVVIGGENG